MLLSSTSRWGSTAIWCGVALMVLPAWGFDLMSTTSNPVRRGALAAISIAAIFGAVTAIQAGQRRQNDDLRALLNRLGCEDIELPFDPITSPVVAALGKPWQTTIHNLCNSLRDWQSRAKAADHARASVEVRIRRLTAERDFLREILTTLPDLVIAIDPFEEVVFANTAAEKTFGIAAEKDGIYGPLATCLRNETLRGLLLETRRVRGGTARNADLTLTDAAGKEQSFRAVCRPLLALNDSTQDARHALHGAALVCADTAALKAMQKRNAEFVSSVSHEMKTPLAGINAYVELLIDGEATDDNTREEFLGVIKNQAERLQRLVENLLNLARIEAGVVKVNKQARSLNEVLQESADVLIPTAELKNIRFNVELSPLYLGVFADRDTLLQAAINLGSNAVKYTQPGGTVTLRSRLDDHEVVFEVQDSGVGLSEADKYKVFEKFYRVKRDSSMAPGTGLGLPLVKHIIEDVHGGRVEVDSELGKGSTFRVVLPATDQIKR